MGEYRQGNQGQQADDDMLEELVHGIYLSIQKLTNQQQNNGSAAYSWTISRPAAS
jgi:hypothetical protein